MRIRSLIAAGTLAVVVLAVSAPPASADPGKAKGKELVECVEKALSKNAGWTDAQQRARFLREAEVCERSSQSVGVLRLGREAARQSRSINDALLYQQIADDSMDAHGRAIPDPVFDCRSAANASRTWTSS